MSTFLDAPANGDTASITSVATVKPSPDTLTKLVKRLRALTLTLLPVEVDPSVINEPTGRIISTQVIEAYKAAAGDFIEALPYCLLRARAEFMWDANHNPADYGENIGRATACEVLARRIVHMAPHESLRSIMSARFRHRQLDGEVSDMTSALEIAIDTQAIIFLSSNEAQEVVDSLWNGDLIQQNNADNDIDYIPYADTREHSFWGHFDTSRLNVPRYQNIFRIVIWLFFLVVYSQAVREPLQRIGDAAQAFDAWEVILYVLALSFTMEDLHKFYLLLRYYSLRALSFWNIIAFITDSLLIAAFTLRVIARMLKESGIFFALLSVLAIGFAQGLYALDASDGSTEGPFVVINILVQGLLQSPDYERFASFPPGLILYYFWTTVTAIILLNILISLFSSAYSEVIENAEAQYMAFFASKTIAMIRAPDTFVYPAPFNLVETFLVAPFESIPGFRLSHRNYATLNRYVMGSLFFVPLTIIAFSEAVYEGKEHSWLKNWLRGQDEGAVDYPESRDPEVDDSEQTGMKISKVPFKELVKAFPNVGQSSDAAIIQELHDLKAQVAHLVQKLEAQGRA
ncbi:hypothetical protein H0H93_000023 [Arthromyces matolae]|nr:hypothetical protein H0H93_000023 [Arthromyces matolae]